MTKIWINNGTFTTPLPARANTRPGKSTWNVRQKNAGTTKNNFSFRLQRFNLFFYIYNLTITQNMMELYYKLNSGKNPKYLYYTKSFIRYAMPKFLFRMQRKRLLKSIRKRQDYAYIQERAAYYNKLDKSTPLPPDAPVLAGHRFRQRTGNSVYFFYSF